LDDEGCGQVIACHKPYAHFIAVWYDVPVGQHLSLSIDQKARTCTSTLEVSIFGRKNDRGLLRLTALKITPTEPHEQIGEQFGILVCAIMERTQNLVPRPSEKDHMIVIDLDAAEIDKVDMCSDLRMPPIF
jgi:hypothetical protein